jgi:tetratricopeptide (TPR) repeat protein
MPDRLRPLWDFDDLDASERRFHAQLEQETSDPRRAEVMTQLARAEGLRGSFARCRQTLDEAEALAGDDAAAHIRLELERGRMFRSSGDLESAFPLFRAAFERAVDAGERYLAGDAAHMCALAAGAVELQEDWTRRGLVDGDPYWAGPLYNNLGWVYFEAGNFTRALELFELALDARLRDPENVRAIEWAHEAIAEAKRALEVNSSASP